MSTPAAPAKKTTRRQQYAETYRMTRKTYPRVGWWMLLSILVGGAIGFGLFWLIPGIGVIRVILAVLGTVLFALLGALVVLARLAPRAAYAQMEGRPGAAAAALRMLRRGWHVEEMIAVTKQQDLVHRVVGPPGIVLIGEGSPHRLRGLLASERRRHERVGGEVPIHDVVVGRGEGQIPLPKLVRHVQKLGRQVKPAELTDVINRLKAIDATRKAVPLPKGPVPTSMKGLRGNFRGR